MTHLIRQSVDDNFKWEVIVVDNASTDDTCDVANSIWPRTVPAKLKVVFEPKLGCAFARTRGLNEAKYDLVSFVDDDNWINPDWLRRVFEIMSGNRNIGACGGYNEFKCEVNTPSWFDKYKESYAVGPQGPETGDITEKRGYLWGAGLTIRRSAWMKIKNCGFTIGCSGRQGDKLRSGEDSELCFALRLSGWRLWYDSELRLTHFIKTEKLTWKYLRGLQRGFGASSIWFDPYLVLLDEGPDSRRRTWKWETLKAGKMFLMYWRSWLNYLMFDNESDEDVLAIERITGRTLALTKRRHHYDVSFDSIKNVYEAIKSKNK